jgi:hypothetical protein
MTRLTTAVALAACTLTVACKAEIAIDLYASDILAVAEGGDPITTPAILSLDGQSNSTCAEMGPTLVKALGIGFPSVAFKGCRNAGFDTWADYTVEVPISREAAAATALAVTATRDAGPVVATLTASKSVMNQIIAALPEDAADAFNNDLDVAITFNLRHDGNAELATIVQGVFLDGEPVQTPRTLHLARRDEIQVRLSNVGDAALLQGGSLLFVLQP